MKNTIGRNAWTAVAAAAVALSIAPRLGGATPSQVPVPARIVTPIDVTDTVTLPGNTHPSAKPAADLGLVPDDQQIESLFIALRRSPSQERGLAKLNARQLDPASPDYHHWLQPREFGQKYGPNDADLAAVTNWLGATGLQVHKVSEGRVTIEFSGTAAQLKKAFGVEMHRYRGKNASAIANDRDPTIPRAVSPVVAGVAGMNTFPAIVPRGSSAASKTAGTAPTPNLSVAEASYNYALLTPFDFAAIYNAFPIWTGSNGSAPNEGNNVTIAIVGDNDVNLNDIATYRSTFGLQAKAPTTQFVGTDPKGSSEYSTASLELAGAAAPAANLILVVPEVPEGGATVVGLFSAVSYIVDKNLAPIVEFGYSACEKAMGTSSNAMINSLWQQGQTQGMTILAAAGDYGSAGCANTEMDAGATEDSDGLQVSGIASSPFVTAVGGTDFAWNWSNTFSTYFSAAPTASPYLSAMGYVPEVPWNTSCTNTFLQQHQGFLLFDDVDGVPTNWPTTQDVCIANAGGFNYGALLKSQGGGGGYSHCTTLDSSGNCVATSGYPKPDWQRGTGVPGNGRRNIPDVSLFASPGWIRPVGDDGQDRALEPIIPSTAILVCYSGTGHPCTYSDFDPESASIGYQTYGGTGAAAAYWAGILALVVQKQGGERQGLVNPTLYNLFSGENLASCNTGVVAFGNSCIFYDVTYPVTNGMPCIPNSSPDCYVDSSSTIQDEQVFGILNGYSAGAGYDRTTGLGTVNITNLVNNWSSANLPPVTASNVAMGALVDYLGDGRSNFAVWRPSTGYFYASNPQATTAAKQWGLPTDIPVVGDFDGDGVTDVAVFRPSNGTWYITESSTGQVVSKQWGLSTDVPVVGDFDGDGKTDIAVWRPSTGYWYIVQSSNGATVAKPWGVSTDVPVVGDFDGDGKTDIAVWRPSTGYWYIVQSSNGATVAKPWGVSSDVPVFGDFDGDGKTDIAVWRPSTGYWYIIQSSNGEVATTRWGQSGDVPVPSDYNGSGKTNLAVWRPSTGTWYVYEGSTQPALVLPWGTSTDLPMQKNLEH